MFDRFNQNWNDTHNALSSPVGWGIKWAISLPAASLVFMEVTVTFTVAKAAELDVLAAIL